MARGPILLGVIGPTGVGKTSIARSIGPRVALGARKVG